MALFTVHFSEISIKGGNRSMFEDKAVASIRRALGDRLKKAEKIEKRLYIETEGEEEETRGALSRTFGVEWYARAYEVRKDKAEIEKFVLGYFAERGALDGKTFKVETKRGDKSLPFTSMDFSRDLGKKIIEKFGCKVDLKKPDVMVYVEIMQMNRAFVHFEKIRGPGGLPAGSSGKVVVLLSGGIDSPLASWMLMKRGAQAVFLHIHPFASAEEAEKSKITSLAKTLARWQNGARICFADYSEFYKKTLAIPPKYELVMFRRFIYALAQEVARKEGALAIVSGDSLGQVASQTLENIYAVNSGLEMPVFRPLIGMNKGEIIDMAKQIGTYDISIMPYKDCCSLVAVENPEIRADAEFVKKLDADIGLKEVVEKTLEKIRIVDIE